MSTPTRISSVRVEGAVHTRHSFLGSLVSPHLAQGDAPPTFQDVLRRVKAMSHTLNRTDVFAVVHPTIERAASLLASEKDVDVVFKVREKGRLYLKTSTDVGNGEGNAVRALTFMIIVCSLTESTSPPSDAFAMSLVGQRLWKALSRSVPKLGKPTKLDWRPR